MPLASVLAGILLVAPAPGTFTPQACPLVSGPVSIVSGQVVGIQGKRPVAWKPDSAIRLLGEKGDWTLVPRIGASAPVFLNAKRAYTLEGDSLVLKERSAVPAGFRPTAAVRGGLVGQDAKGWITRINWVGGPTPMPPVAGFVKAGVLGEDQAGALYGWIARANGQKEAVVWQGRNLRRVAPGKPMEAVAKLWGGLLLHRLVGKPELGALGKTGFKPFAFPKENSPASLLHLAQVGYGLGTMGPKQAPALFLFAGPRLQVFALASFVSLPDSHQITSMDGIDGRRNLLLTSRSPKTKQTARWLCIWRPSMSRAAF